VFCRRVSARGTGCGHDPDLVADLYREFTPQVFGETTVSVHDSRGEERTVTAVHLRDRTRPLDEAELEAQFADGFVATDAHGVGDAETYTLPAVRSALDVAGTRAPSGVATDGGRDGPDR
jgi:hypothetical protein